MKKLKSVLLPIILISSLTLSMFVVASCTDNRLSTPQNVSINLDNYILSWSRVDNARAYEIEVYSLDDDETRFFEVSSTKVSYSLQSLAEGDYEIRVMASAGSSKSYSDSGWSDPISLNKDYYSGCTFTLINNSTEYEITGWSRPGDGLTDIIIPAEYRDKPVVGIGDNAFKAKSTLTSVEIQGDNLRYIGKNAFYSCTRLQSISIPDSVEEIAEGAFHSCRVLEKFTVPAGVTEIADSTFLYCRALESVDLGNVETVGESAFLGCNEELTEIYIPDTVTAVGEKAFSECSVLKTVSVGSGTEEISDSAFQNDKALETVEFRESDGGSALRQIGEYAFSGCTSLKAADLPEGTETIGAYSFYKDTALESTDIPKSVTEVGAYAFADTALYDGQGNRAFVYAGLERSETDKNYRAWVIGCNSSALNCEGDTYAVAADDFESTAIGIADRAFYRIGAIGSVNIPDNIQYIGDRAFYGCTNVTEIVIMGADEFPKDVEIGPYAFASMTQLSNFRFANATYTSGVKSVGDHAFYGDTGLRSIEIPESVERIGGYAFYDTYLYTKDYDSGNGLDEDTQVVYAGGNSTGTSKMWAVGYGDYIDDIELKSDTWGVADYAFTRQTYLQYITGLSSVNYIGEGAFYKCSALTQVSVPRSIEEIAPYTFYGCESMVSVGSGLNTYLNNLKTIGRSAFYGCESLNGLDLSYSQVRYIGKYAFYCCTSLQHIDLNSTLEEIDDYAFYKSGLQSVDLPDSVTRVGDKCFYKNESLESVSFGTGIESIGDYSFYKCAAMKEIYIPGNITDIGNYAFYKCSAAEKLTLKNGVKKIGNGAFASLGITSLTIPSSVKEIGDYGFKSCKNLSSVIIPSTVEKIGDNAFYGISDATFYTDADDYLPQWSTRLNSSFRPMVWGCTLSEDATHVVSVTISAGSVANVVRIEGNEEPVADAGTADVDSTPQDGEDEDQKPTGQVNYSRMCAAPVWDGHEFLGWALTDGGRVVYGADELDLVFDERGETVLYAVWEQI